MVTTGKVRAAHAAHKQHIAHKRTFGFLRVKHHMARCVARAVAHIQGAIANLNRVAIDQPTVGCERFTQGKVEHAALVGQSIDPELVTHVWADDGQVQLLGQFCHPTCVVNVRVGEPDCLQLQIAIGNSLLEFVQIATGVDDGGLVGFTAPHDGTVLCKRCDRNGVVAKHVACG